MEDRQIIELYLSRDESAIARTQEKYGGLISGITNKILDSEDSMECVNDTFLKVWESIPPDNPLNFKAYICKISRNLALNRLKYNNRQKRSSDCIVSLSELEEIVPDRTNIDDEQLGQVINNFLGTLKPNIRNVFIRKYWFFDSISEISQRYNYSDDKVKSMLYHTRNKLRKYLKKEGIYL